MRRTTFGCKHETLNEAIRTDGWPTLATSRGEVIILMIQQALRPAYLEGHPSLRGRLIFTNTVPGSPDAAYAEMKDNDEAAIAEQVRDGYIVRVRADTDTQHGSLRRHCASRASAAWRCADDQYGLFRGGTIEVELSWYSVALPGGLAARCNPVSKPKGCVTRSWKCGR